MWLVDSFVLLLVRLYLWSRGSDSGQGTPDRREFGSLVPKRGTDRMRFRHTFGGKGLRQFGPDRAHARERYRRFVLDGVGRGIREGLRQQIYLSDEAFVKQMQAKAEVRGDVLSVVPQATYSYRQIAERLGAHSAMVGRIVRKAMRQCEN